MREKEEEYSAWCQKHSSFFLHSTTFCSFSNYLVVVVMLVLHRWWCVCVSVHDDPDFAANDGGGASLFPLFSLPLLRLADCSEYVCM